MDNHFGTRSGTATMNMGRFKLTKLEVTIESNYTNVISKLTG